MVKKVDYQFKTDKRGYKYALKVNLKTGKKQRIKYKLATKRASDLKYKHKRSEKEKELKGKGATWSEFQQEKKIAKKELKKKYAKEGKKVKPKTLKRRAKVEADKKVGVRSRIRFNWTYWEMPTCNTPVFIAYGHAEDGDHYESFKQEANEILEDIHLSNLCPHTEILGGACVVLYKRKTKQILKMHELGEGCVKGVERGM